MEHGIGGGTITNLCEKIANVGSFEEIVDLSKKGNLSKIDIQIGDVTNKKIVTLPSDLTLSNFGKLEKDAKKEDIILGIVNMVFEVIGMMAVFALKNDNMSNVVIIGSATKIPCIKTILKKIEKLHKINFIIPNNAEYACAIGAIKEGKV